MSTKVTSSLKKPLTTYLEEQQPIGTLNNGSVNTSASSGGLSTSGSVPQPPIALSPESVSSAQNSTNVQAPTYVSALETTVNPNTIANNNVTSLPNVNAGAMTNVTYKDAVKEPENVTADGNTTIYSDGSGNYYTIDAESGMIVRVDESGNPITSESESKEETPKLGYTEWLDLQKTNIAQAYEDAKKAAETQRQRAVHNAGGMYQQALSQYGANAAAMSAMGLTGSGYTKYLDSQALAQKQGAINAANSDYQSALSSADATKRSAENEVAGLYAQYLENAENTPNTKETGVDPYKVFTEIYNNIDAYSIADIDRLTRNAGLAADSQYVKDLKEKRTQEVLATLASGKYDKAFLDTLFKIGDMDVPSYREWIAKLYGDDPAEVLKKNDEEYNTWLSKKTNEQIEASQVMQNIDTGVNAFLNENGNGYLSPNEANQEIENMKQNGATPAQIEALQASYAQLYTPAVSSGVKFLKDNDLSGGRITLTNSDGTKKYKVRAGEELTDPTVVQSVQNGQVFTYRGGVYVKYNDKCYAIEARMNETSYTELLNDLKTESGG